MGEDGARGKDCLRARGHHLCLTDTIFYFPKRLKNEFETAVVKEPSMFKPLKVYCKFYSSLQRDMLICGYGKVENFVSMHVFFSLLFCLSLCRVTITLKQTKNVISEKLMIMVIIIIIIIIIIKFRPHY